MKSTPDEEESDSREIEEMQIKHEKNVEDFLNIYKINLNIESTCLLLAMSG